MSYRTRQGFLRREILLVSSPFCLICAIFLQLDIDCLLLMTSLRIYFYFCSREATPPLVVDIHEWVSAILPHTMGIYKWESFHEKFGRKPLTSELVRCSSVLFFTS